MVLVGMVAQWRKMAQAAGLMLARLALTCGSTMLPASSRALAFLEWPSPGSGILTGGLADRAIGRERHRGRIDGGPVGADVQRNDAPRSITSVRSFRPACAKDQRRLAFGLIPARAAPANSGTMRPVASRAFDPLLQPAPRISAAWRSG